MYANLHEFDIFFNILIKMLGRFTIVQYAGHMLDYKTSWESGSCTYIYIL